MVLFLTVLTTIILALMSLLYSMGGSVAVHVAAKKVLTSLCGLVVVDVVEVWPFLFLFPEIPLYICLLNAILKLC